MFQRIGTLDSERKEGDAPDAAYNEKSQRLGRQLVAGLYMLLRSSKLYDPANAIFVKPVAQLVELMNLIFGRDHKLLLQFTPDAIYLNEQLLRLDASSFENQRELIHELRAKKIFGLSLTKPAASGDVLALLRKLSREEVETAATPGEQAAFQLMANDLAERIRGAQAEMADAESQATAIDRRKYLLTVYARAVYFLRNVIEGQSNGRPIPGSKAMGIVQQLVDLVQGQRSQVVGLTSLEDVRDYPLFHAVNTALLAIVFGAELGLGKAQLRDLGYTALFHDLGRAQLPKSLGERKELSAEDRARIARARFDSVRAVIGEGGLSRANLLRLAVSFEHSEPVAAEVKDDAGNVTMVMPRGRLLIYSRIVALCSVYDALTSRRPYREPYGPEIALMMMWTEMKAKFDPDLLEAFVRLMGPAELEFLSGAAASFSLS